MCFFDKNSVKCVKWRNPCYFLWKKTCIKPGIMLIETVLFGDSFLIVDNLNPPSKVCISQGSGVV